MSHKENILFVDDEPYVLNGLKRMLRPLRHQFGMTFTDRGEKALSIVSEDNVDVIVCDMRMPGMSGIALLEEVKRNYPEIIRIILSGQAEKEEILKSINITHRYLAKPCSPETLKSTLEDSISLRNTLSDKELRKVISQIGNIPSPPAIYQKILKELRSPRSSMKQIGDIVSQDMAMSSKVLQIVNSAYFGVCQRITSPTKAVSFLGLEALKALVLSNHVFSSIESETQHKELFIKLWDNSIRTASFARNIAKSENMSKEEVEVSFTSGLLHKIGIVILASKFPLKYSKVLSIVKLKSLSLVEAEREVFGSDHTKVGAYHLRLWGIPDPIVETIAYYTDPREKPICRFKPLKSLYSANIIENILNDQEVLWKMPDIKDSWAEWPQVEERLETWLYNCREIELEKMR